MYVHANVTSMSDPAFNVGMAYYNQKSYKHLLLQHI